MFAPAFANEQEIVKSCLARQKKYKAFHLVNLSARSKRNLRTLSLNLALRGDVDYFFYPGNIFSIVDNFAEFCTILMAWKVLRFFFKNSSTLTNGTGVVKWESNEPRNEDNLGDLRTIKNMLIFLWKWMMWYCCKYTRFSLGELGEHTFCIF